MQQGYIGIAIPTNHHSQWGRSEIVIFFPDHISQFFARQPAPNNIFGRAKHARGIWGKVIRVPFLRAMAIAPTNPTITQTSNTIVHGGHERRVLTKTTAIPGTKYGWSQNCVFVCPDTVLAVVSHLRHYMCAYIVHSCSFSCPQENSNANGMQQGQQKYLKLKRFSFIAEIPPRPVLR